MTAASILATVARLILASIAGTLVKDGVLDSSGTEAFIGAGMLVATGLWGLWNNYGKDIAKAELALLRARVMSAAAKAQASPAAAQAAVASVAAHVEATTPPDEHTASAAASVAILAIGAWCLLPPEVHAQTRRPLTGDPIKDLGTAITGQKATSTAATNETTLDIVGKLQSLALPDFEYALAMAKATNNVVSTPCWQAWVDLISAQQKPLMAADGTTPLTLPDPHLVVDVERVSELLAALRPDSPLSTSCAALAGAAGKDVATLVGGILSGGALGLFKLPIAIP